MTLSRKTSMSMDTTAFAALGPGQLRPGRASDDIDGLTPDAVITARSVEQIAAALGEARAQGLGVIVTGGGTRAHIGNIARSFDIRLSTTALASVMESSPEDMTVTVESGITLARLNRVLAKEGQRIPLDPPMPDSSSLGGLVATNYGGGLRYGFGTCRDLVLGMRVVDGCLRELETGGRVVKNVAGYDLPRLFTGSWGTLGVITELTLRTYPVAERRRTLLFDFAGPADLEAARAKVFHSDLPLVAFDFATDLCDGQPSWTLALHVEGTEEQVACQSERLCQLTGREPLDSAEEWWSPAHADANACVVLRLGVRPAASVTAAARLLKEIPSELPNLAVGGHLGDGIVRVSVPEESAAAEKPVMAAASKVAAELAGRLVIETASASRKRGIDVWGENPASIELMRQIKSRFDPDGILAPGRFVGGL